jgi:hypothetical protein
VTQRRPLFRCKQNYHTITNNDDLYSDVNTTIIRSSSQRPLYRCKHYYHVRIVETNIYRCKQNYQREFWHWSYERYVYIYIFGYSSQSVDQIRTVINHDLLELNAWSSKLLMSFNPEKTEILVFSNTPPSSRRLIYRCRQNYHTITNNDDLYSDANKTIIRSRTTIPKKQKSWFSPIPVTSNFLLMAQVSLYLLVISIWELSSPKIQNGMRIYRCKHIFHTINVKTPSMQI